jgi:DNA-binding MarR family transcriptional regulator
MQEEIVKKFTTAMKRLKSNKFNYNLGMPHSEFMIMQVIHCQTKDNQSSEALTLTELSEIVQISKAAVSQIISALEEKGFIERSTPKKDRRIVYVKLTEEGEKTFEASMVIATKRLSFILEKLGQEDAETFIRLLDKFAELVVDFAASDSEEVDSLD